MARCTDHEISDNLDYECKPSNRSVPSGTRWRGGYVRSAKNRAVYIVINFANDPKRLVLPEVMYDVLNNVRVRSLTLSHYDIRILERDYRE
jgi:Beta-galactosidase C-terminal domain